MRVSKLWLNLYCSNTIHLTYSNRKRRKSKVIYVSRQYTPLVLPNSVFFLYRFFFVLIFAFILSSFLCCAQVCFQWERGHMSLCIDWCCSCRQRPVNQKCLEENFKLSPFIKINSTLFVLLNFSSLQSHKTLLQNSYKNKKCAVYTIDKFKSAWNISCDRLFLLLVMYNRMKWIFEQEK